MRTTPSLPLVTADLPPCGGAAKSVPEDFEVEELPAYEPCGEGEHLFLWVEKRGRSSQDVAAALALALGIPERDVSYAGMKDRQAVTRQLFSLPARHEERLSSFTEPGVRVLWARRHRNKLKTGHLKGNRFRIRLRDVQDVGAAKGVVEALSSRGFPNYFGEQRFGRAGDNAQKGLELLRGRGQRVSRFERRLLLSALQSDLFNQALAARLLAGTFPVALAGDVMKKLATGGVFVCTEPGMDQPRVDSFEVSPAGPLFGPRMEQAQGEVAATEAELLARSGLTLQELAAGGDETAGGRRPYRLPLREVALEPVEDGLWLSFSLPKGSYATVLLRELLAPR